MQIINGLLIVVFLPILLVYISAIIKPTQKSIEKSFGKNPTRRSINKGFIPLLSILFILIGITAPPAAPSQNASSQSQYKQQEIEAEAARTREAARVEALEAAKPRTKEVIEESTIPYTTETREDKSLSLGQSRTTREGIDGTKSVTYEITYENGTETNRTTKSERVTKEPVSKLVAKGTYVTPSPSSSSSAGSGYTNSQGNHVPSPSSNPAGATAKCSDGTYSYSQSRRGTCSHHGGVAIWL